MQKTLKIINEKGLHARASARFVETVEAFEGNAMVTRNGETVEGTSIMGLLMLAAVQGAEISVETSGQDAEALMKALETLVAECFGEER